MPQKSSILMSTAAIISDFLNLEFNPMVKSAWSRMNWSCVELTIPRTLPKSEILLNSQISLTSIAFYKAVVLDPTIKLHMLQRSKNDFFKVSSFKIYLRELPLKKTTFLGVFSLCSLRRRFFRVLDDGVYWTEDDYLLPLPLEFGDVDVKLSC